MSNIPSSTAEDAIVKLLNMSCPEFDEFIESITNLDWEQWKIVEQIFIHKFALLLASEIRNTDFGINLKKLGDQMLQVAQTLHDSETGCAENPYAQPKNPFAMSWAMQLTGYCKVIGTYLDQYSKFDMP